MERPAHAQPFQGFWSLRATCVLVTQTCPTLCDPTVCSPSASFVHSIFQARILEWVAISFSKGSSQPRDGTCVRLQADSLLSEPPGKSLRAMRSHLKGSFKHAHVCIWISVGQNRNELEEAY